MRLEDLMLLEGWAWRTGADYFTLKPGDTRRVVDYKGKGFFVGTIASFYGHPDAQFAYLTVKVDDKYYMPESPFYLAALGLFRWTPYGVLLLAYDPANNNYAVGVSPAWLIPVKRKLVINIGFPKRVPTPSGEHENAAEILCAYAYAYIVIEDEEAFMESLRKLRG